MSQPPDPPSQGLLQRWIDALGSGWRHGSQNATRIAAGPVPRAVVRRIAAAAQVAAATITPKTAAQQPTLLPAAATVRWRRLLSSGAAIAPARLPLPITTRVLLVLVLVPALLLWRLPRPRAVGLEQLLQHVSLLQSFPASPERPVPALWRERLGAQQAELIWRRQRGPWWQLWSQHADSPPLLAISAATLPGGSSGPLPNRALRVGDLVVIAPDPLSRLLLRDQLLPQQRLSRGLQHRCLERLRHNQAVLWSPAGTAAILGPLAPLLQRYERGCFSFSIQGGGLLWQGEAAEQEQRPSLLAAAGTAEPLTALPPLPADQLLEIELGKADLLLQGLLERPLIRDPLARRYGIDAAGLQLLRSSPIRLRLRSVAQGPFQARLELQLPVGSRRQPWQALLARLSASLLDQGFSPLAAGAASASAPTGAAAALVAHGAAAGPALRTAAGFGGPATDSGRDGITWRRGDGVVVGGWRWIALVPGRQQLLFFLGPAPQGSLLPLPESAVTRSAELRLRSRPRALAALELLPGEPPELVRRADQLWMRAQPPAGSGETNPISRLAGGLQLGR